MNPLTTFSISVTKQAEESLLRKQISLSTKFLITISNGSRHLIIYYYTFWSIYLPIALTQQFETFFIRPNLQLLHLPIPQNRIWSFAILRKKRRDQMADLIFPPQNLQMYLQLF